MNAVNLMRTKEMTIRNLSKFTYDVYIDFLKFLQLKYRLIPFSEILEVNDPYIILRHDIDASLGEALTMAKIENTLKIRSTYFVLFSHKLYNLLEKDSLNILREISELGHEIGIHYDLEVYKTYHPDLKKILENEIRLLENLLSKKISSIACHNPSDKKINDPFIDVSTYINAYNPKFYDLYVSDSCRAWYNADLSGLLSFNFKRVQLLIHPILWTKIKCNRDYVLERYFQKIKQMNSDYKLKWLEIWHKTQKVIDYDKLIAELE